MSRAEALRLHTRGSAWFSSEEELKGRIAPGAYADLAVLSEDYFAVPADRISGIESVLTVVDGKIVRVEQNARAEQNAKDQRKAGTAFYDLSQFTVMPGWIDLHDHVVSQFLDGSGLDPADQLLAILVGGDRDPH